MISPGPSEEGSKPVLLVEDDAEVRQVVRLMLETEGYPVLEAETADDALQMFRQTPESVPLLIADVALPGMTGPELAARVCSERPQMLVLFISGHPYDTLIEEGRLSPQAAFLQKPFAPSELARKVRELLCTKRTVPA